MAVLSKNYNFNSRVIGDEVDFGGVFGIRKWTGTTWVSVTTTATTITSVTSADKPVSPQDGMIIYNSDIDRFEGYINNNWVSINASNVKVSPKYLTIGNFYF